ncbi:MAG: hypothetical protein GY838_14825, partial [bacterium]|nr:hypothetical protein [bacterium]
VLSRLKEARRGSTSGGGADPSLTVAYSSYDLASRPAAESVGSRAALAWKYDTWGRPEEVTLPAGVARVSGGDFSGFQRQYDTLDRISDVSGLGQLTTSPLGASWSWGGADRLYGFTTKAQLGTAVRFGYIGGPGAQPPGGVGDTASQWRLGTLTWGSTADDVPGVSATEPPGTVWGQFSFGWRGTEGDPRDGVKLGRGAVDALQGGGLDLFAGMGWSWVYDAGVRLSHAIAGRGDIQGR